MGSTARRLRFRRNTLEERGARASAHSGAQTDSLPRDADAAAPPQTPTAAIPVAQEPRPRCQTVCSTHPPCRCHVRRELLEADARSLSLRQAPKLRLSPWKDYRLEFPRRLPHKSSGHLPLPGACGVYTPRRRSEPARAERERFCRRGQEEEREGGARARGTRSDDAVRRRRGFLLKLHTSVDSSH